MHISIPAIALALAAPLLAHPLDSLATRAAPETIYLVRQVTYLPNISSLI